MGAANPQQKAISGDMTIGEILSGNPSHQQKLVKALADAGLACGSCDAAASETLEAGVLSHGMDISDVEALIRKLNAILEEEFDLSTISLTKRAARKFQEIAEEEGQKGCALRFGDSAGGCGGFEYVLDFSSAPDLDDEVFHSHGVDIHVKKGMLSRLLGSVIDFVDGLRGAGFKVSNPNVKSGCGCGKSQGY